MFFNIVKIFGVFIASVLLACIVYGGKLYSETTSAFEKLKTEIEQTNAPSEAELFIKDVLFKDTNKIEATPADLIARNKLNLRTSKIAPHQLKKSSLPLD